MNTDPYDLPLFKWQPPACRLIAFPPQKRIGKIRDVARKWRAQRTHKLADKYAAQIDSDLRSYLHRIGTSPAEIDRLACEFWQAVQAEIFRLGSSAARPGGDAA